MILAISLVKAVPDHEKMVYIALKDVKGVKNLYHIFGAHDFFLMLEAENMNNLTRILDDIKNVRYVGSIKSILVASASRRSMNKSNIHTSQIKLGGRHLLQPVRYYFFLNMLWSICVTAS